MISSRFSEHRMLSKQAPSLNMPRRRIVERNNVSIKGQGDVTLVFAHGFGCGQAMWSKVAARFFDSHRCVLFDYVGSGQSDLSAYEADRYGSLSGYAQDVTEICDALDLRNVVFVGHSVSAMIGVMAAIDRPDLIAKLVMLAPSPRYINEPGYHGGFERGELLRLLQLMDTSGMGWAGHLAETLLSSPRRTAAFEELHTSFCSTDPVTARRFAEVTFFSDSRGLLSQCSSPSLVLQSEQDLIAPHPVGQYVASRLENCDIEQLPVVGHCPHLTDPDLVSAAIQGYLASKAEPDSRRR
jgi:sigma-B regulation protein RsbQ